MSRGKNEANSNFLKLLILWKLYLWANLSTSTVILMMEFD